MKKIIAVTVLIALTNLAQAQEQLISLVYEPTVNTDGAGIASIYYQASDDALTTGVGFRIHFNSREVRILDIKELLPDSSLGLQILSDEEDHDGDPLTDQFINVGWVDLLGEWPDGNKGLTQLLEVTYDSALPPGADVFAISESASAAGFTFAARLGR